MGDRAGGFAEVRNFEILAEQEDERKRQEELLQLAVEEKHRQEDIKSRDPATDQEGIDTFRHYDEIDSRKHDARALELANPSRTAADRLLEDLGPAREMAFETGEEKTFGLKNDPRGRGARLQGMLDQIEGRSGAGGEGSQQGPDAPIYYSGPSRHEGDPNDTMPYEGKLEALRGAPINRAAIRQEFGGTAPDEALSFTNRPEAVTPDMRRYDTERGTHKDVGAPGGSVGSIGGGPEGEGAPSGARRLVIEALRSENEQAKLAPPTLREQAGEFVTSTPALNKAALELDPNQLDSHIMQLVSEGKLSGQVGKIQAKRYQHLMEQATNDDGVFDREVYNDLVRREGEPTQPSATADAVRQGGGKVEQAEEQKTAALKAAVESPPGAPGSTRSPVETQGQPEPAVALPPAPSESMGGPSEQGVGAVDWEQFKRTAPKAVRLGAPMLGMAAGSLAGLPNVGAGVGGFVGDLSAQALGGEDLNFGKAGAAGLIDAAGGKVLGGLAGVGKKLLGAGRRYVEGVRGAKALGEGIEGSFGPAAFEPRTSTFQGEIAGGAPLRETAGSAGPGSTLDRLRQGAAEVGSTPIPKEAVAYNPANIPAIRGQNFSMGGEGPLMSPGRPMGGASSPLQIEGPSGDELLQLMQRGGGEGAKQLVPQLQAMSPEAKEGLLEQMRAVLSAGQAQGMPVTARAATELLAMMMRAGR